MYCCRGFVCDENDFDTFDKLFNALLELGKEYKAYCIKIDPEIVIQSRIFRAAHLPDDKQDKRKCRGSPKQPDNDSFCGKASFCSTFLQRNR